MKELSQVQIQTLKARGLTDERIAALAEKKGFSMPRAPRSAGQKVLDAGTGVSNFLGAKGLTDLAGSQAAKFKLAASGNMKAANMVEQPSMRNVLGSTAQFGANFIPGAGVGAGIVKKVGVGLATGYAFDVGSKLQTDKSLPSAFVPGVGTAVGGALPVAGAVLNYGTSVVGRFFKGVGSGLSGVPNQVIDTLMKNPQAAKNASKQLIESGNDKILEANAREIVNGVSKIRQEARSAFGKGLDELSSTDIQPDVFRQGTQKVLEKYGVSLKDGARTLANVEFDDPKNLQKASDLIDKLSNTDLDGKSLRKLADDIENAAYKVATSDERLSFNVFVRDLSSTLKESISQSTSKLDDINKAFSIDMQLAEATQDIFGNVDFKNLSEVLGASKKLETLFAQKGLAPKVIDDFLTRIGVAPGSFRATEAVRQIADKGVRSNAPGLSIAELAQSFTSAIITPGTVKNLSIATGLAGEKLRPVLQLLSQMKPAAAKVLINGLLQSGRQEPQKTPL